MGTSSFLPSSPLLSSHLVKTFLISSLFVSSLLFSSLLCHQFYLIVSPLIHFGPRMPWFFRTKCSVYCLFLFRLTTHISLNPGLYFQVYFIQVTDTTYSLNRYIICQILFLFSSTSLPLNLPKSFCFCQSVFLLLFLYSKAVCFYCSRTRADCLQQTGVLECLISLVTSPSTHFSPLSPSLPLSLASLFSYYPAFEKKKERSPALWLRE